MKKFLILIAVAVMLVSCGKSPEQKANALIKEHLRKTLYHPDTYDPVETIIDSAFYPNDSPEVHKKVNEMYEFSVQYAELEDEIKRAKSDMLIFANPYDAWSRNKYNEDREKYENLLAQQEQMKEMLDQYKKEYETLVEKNRHNGKKFIGFKVIHSFRCQNNAGNTLMGRMWFLMDKDFTEIQMSYDMDSQEYELIQSLTEGEDAVMQE